MSLCRRTVEDRLPLERVPLACTFGSPLDLHVRESLRGGGGGFVVSSSCSMPSYEESPEEEALSAEESD